MKSKLVLTLAFLSFFSLSNIHAQSLQLSADKTKGCSPLQVSFTCNGETGANYQWDFGNGSKSTQKNPSLAFFQPGVYKVNLSVTANGKTETASTNVTVFASPVAEFETAKHKACVSEPVNFTSKSTGASPIVNYVWGFGDGKTVSGSSMTVASHFFKEAGTSDVSLMVTDANGCMGTKTAYSVLEVTPKPVVDFKPSVTSSCNSTQQIAFENQSTGGNLQLSWAFGDKGTSTEVNPSHLFTQGKYDVTLTAKDENGCSNSMTKKVAVTKLTADFITEKEQACTGEDLKFVNTSNFKGSKWAWEFSDGTTSTECNPVKVL